VCIIASLIILKKHLDAGHKIAGIPELDTELSKKFFKALEGDHGTRALHSILNHWAHTIEHAYGPTALSAFTATGCLIFGTIWSAFGEQFPNIEYDEIEKRVVNNLNSDNWVRELQLQFLLLTPI